MPGGKPEKLKEGRLLGWTGLSFEDESASCAAQPSRAHIRPGPDHQRFWFQCNENVACKGKCNDTFVVKMLLRKLAGGDSSQKKWIHTQQGQKTQIKKHVSCGMREVAASRPHCFSTGGSCFVVPCECGEHSCWGLRPRISVSLGPPSDPS